MSVISKERYEILKLLPEEKRSQKQRDAMVDYERAEAKAPSLAEVESATRIHNALTSQGSLVNTNPAAKRKLEEANKILDADRAYAATLGNRADKAYVRPVKHIPSDLDSDFNFNWKSVYENTHPEEKLRDTEADYDKLKKYIDSNMYELGEPVNLHRKAYDFNMYNPNTMTWTDFINSEQGNEFKKYLEDVRKNQQNKIIDDIFSGKEPTKANYPIIGPTNVPGSNFAVDFAFPVSKQAAYNAVKKGEEPKLGIPVALDLGTNFLMATQPGAKSVSPVIAKGSNFLAPAVQNAGQMIVNDEDPVAAGIQTVMGGAVNWGTPYALNRINRYTRMPGQQYSQRAAIGERVDQIADKVGNIEKRLNDGALIKSSTELMNESGKVAKGTFYYNNKKKRIFTDYPALKEMFKEQGYKVSPLKDMRKWKAGILSEADHKYWETNSGVLRRGPFNKTMNEYDKAVYDNNYKQYLDKQYKNVAASQAEGKEISQMNRPELEAMLRGPARETYMNWVSRNTPEPVSNYLTNAVGRSQMGTGVLSLPQMIFQTNLGKVVEERKKKKPVISEIFGE